MASNEKRPSLVVVAVRSALVARLMSLTEAPDTTLPCGSLTVPRIMEVPCCANIVKVHNPIMRRTLANRVALLKNIRVFIESSDAKFFGSRRPGTLRRRHRELMINVLGGNPGH